MLKSGANPNLITDSGVMSLNFILGYGRSYRDDYDCDKFELLVKYGANVFHKNGISEANILHESRYTLKPEIVFLLMRCGYSIVDFPCEHL